MKYHGFEIVKTNTMTTIRVRNSRGYTSERVAPLYEITGLKECGKRPFLTSIEQCKEYIRDEMSK